MTTTAKIIEPDSNFAAQVSTGLRPYSAWMQALEREECPVAGNCDLIAQICNLLFETSLEWEEGRHVRGTICIGQPEYFSQPLTFRNGLRFDVQNLVRVLTASKKSAVGVRLANDGELEIWGTGERPLIGSTCFSIIRPGTIAITASGSVIPHATAGIIRKGVPILPMAADHETFRDFLTAGLSKRIGVDLEDVEVYLRLVYAMCDHQHGGIIIITTDDTESSAVDIKFPVDDGFSQILRTSVLSYKASLPPETGIPLRAEQARHNSFRSSGLSTVLERVGALTSVDGALVLTKDFQILGFGAKLKARSTEFRILSRDALTDAASTEVQLADLGGTRHQSTATFLSKNRSAVAFVSSQDGRLSFMAWNGDYLFTVKGLEYFVPAY